MTAPNPTVLRRGRGRPRGLPTITMPIKMTADLRKRLKVAAAEEGVTYAGLFEMFLDQRAARLDRQRKAQAHPLHRPPASAYPGGGQPRTTL